MMSENNDTYVIATNSGDQAFLQFITDRLVHKYGEDPNTDFVLTMQKFADNIVPLFRDAQGNRNDG